MRVPARFWIALILSLLTLTVALAQDEQCPALVENVLTAVGDSCGVLDRNSVCYGFNRVRASFASEVPDDFFAVPADTAGLVDVRTITTAAFNPARPEWGVAVMNVQANVPGTLPGQAVKFLLFGDSQLENAVPPEEAITDTLPAVDVIPSTNANIRSGPGLNYNVVGGTSAGAAISADGRNADASWVRVSHNGSIAWISRTVLQASDAIDTLTVVSEEARSPMQAVYFRTGFSQPDCAGAPPNALVIQGPQNVRVSLTLNGADVTLGSTVVLVQSGPGQLSLLTVDGTARVDDRMNVPRGFAVQVNVDDNGEVIGQWGGFHAFTQSELSMLQFLELIPASLLNYPIDVPTAGEIQAILDSIRRAQATPVAAPSPTPTTGSGAPPPVVTEPPTYDPANNIAEFFADRTEILQGECVRITWNTLNSREIYFEGAAVTGSETVERCPRDSERYFLTVIFNDGSRADRALAIVVNQRQRQDPPTPTPTEKPLIIT